MHLFTFSSKVWLSFCAAIRPIVVSLLTCIFILVLYNALVTQGIIKPSNGLNQWQGNIIKAERYAYQNPSSSEIVLVGSSIIDRIRTSDIDLDVVNLGMPASCSQTGLEVVKRTKVKPKILLVELNKTIIKGVNSQLIASLYNPFLYPLRLHVPMFRQEYQPIATIFVRLINNNLLERYVRASYKQHDELSNPILREKLVKQAFEQQSKPLSSEDKRTLLVEIERIRNQILELEKDGVQVILIDVPGEQIIQDATSQKQARELIQKSFPNDTFEWLPQPRPKSWTTSDGIHLISADAKSYATFLRDELKTRI